MKSGYPKKYNACSALKSVTLLSLAKPRYALADYSFKHQSNAAHFIRTSSPDPQDALAKANIIVPGSRVKYRMLFKGNKEEIENFAQWVNPTR